jgi:hypothetical protein
MVLKMVGCMPATRRAISCFIAWVSLDGFPDGTIETDRHQLVKSVFGIVAGDMFEMFGTGDLETVAAGQTFTRASGITDMADPGGLKFTVIDHSGRQRPAFCIA